MSRRLTKQACAELRTELRDLGYGQAEGDLEVDDLLRRLGSLKTAGRSIRGQS